MILHIFIVLSSQLALVSSRAGQLDEYSGCQRLAMSISGCTSMQFGSDFCHFGILMVAPLKKRQETEWERAASLRNLVGTLT